MPGPGLPVNIDSTYADDGTDASVKAHQQAHDALHAIANAFDTAIGTAAAGQLLAWNGTVYAPASLTPASVIPAVGSWLLDPATNGTGNLNQSEQELDVVPRTLPPGTYDSVAVNVAGAGSAGAVFRVAVYSDSGGAPAALIGQSAAIDGTTTGIKQIALGAPFTVAGLGAVVWAGVVCQGGATTRPSFTRVTGQALHPRFASAPTDFTSISIPNYYVGGVSAAPPSTWTATNRFDSGARLAFHRSA